MVLDQITEKDRDHPKFNANEEEILADAMQHNDSMELHTGEKGMYISSMKIYIAIEEEDLDEIIRLLNLLGIQKWSMGMVQYKGATPLHWAALHGRMDVVSFICKKIAPYKEEPSESEKSKAWSAIVNARDEFGFTPLHLAVSLILRRSGCSDESKAKIDQRAGNCAQLIKELYQIGVPHCMSTSSQSNFLVRNLSHDNKIYVDDYLSYTNLYPIHLGVCSAHPRILERLLESSPDQAWAENNIRTGDTILHYARGCEVLIMQCSKAEWGKIETTLSMYLDKSSKVVNSRNYSRETPLHRAVHARSAKWVGVLLQCEHIRFNLRDLEKLTPGEYAVKMFEELKRASSSGNSEGIDSIKGIINLIDSSDPENIPRQRAREMEIQKQTEARQRERQVYVDAANAILVGAALIASASFGAWLQPPLGLHPYYFPEFLDTSAPPPLGPTYQSFVAIQQYWTIQLFWIFNSLSFFFSLATVIAGADAALPQRGLNVEKALISVKSAVKLAAWLLIAAILSVIGTFATLGFTVLPPITKFQINMICTLVIGAIACVVVLVK